MVWLHILKNCTAKKGTEPGVTNPKSDAILLTFFLVKHFSKFYCYIKSSDLSFLYTHTHTLHIFKSLYLWNASKREQFKLYSKSYVSFRVV